MHGLKLIHVNKKGSCSICEISLLIFMAKPFYLTRKKLFIPALNSTLICIIIADKRGYEIDYNIYIYILIWNAYIIFTGHFVT